MNDDLMYADDFVKWLNKMENDTVFIVRMDGRWRRVWWNHENGKLKWEDENDERKGKN